MTINNNTPDIRFSGFGADWVERKLGDIANFSKGSGYSKSDLRSTGYPIILYGRLYTKYQTVIDEVDTFVNESKNSIKSQGNEVIVPASGETAEDIARASAVKQKGIILGGDLNVVGLSDAYNSVFTALKISNGQSKSELSKKAQGKSVVHIRNSDLQSLLLDFPNLEEQTTISNFFQHIDETISLSRSKHKKTKILKKSFLNKIFPQAGKNQPEIRLKGFSGDWVEKRLRDIGSEFNGGGTPDTRNSNYWNGDIPWLQSSDIEAGNLLNNQPRKYITLLGVNNSATKVIPENSIAIITRVGVGKVALIPFAYSTSQDFLSISNLNVDSLFLIFALSILMKKESNSTQGTSIKGITNKALLERKIATPKEKEEQTAIGQFFKQLDDTLALQAKQLKALESLRKALLAKMFV